MQINLKNHSFSSALTETANSILLLAQIKIQTPYDVNSADKRYKSDLKNADYAISITAVVIGSLSVAEKKNTLLLVPSQL